MSEINYQEAYEREHEKCADLADKIVVLESEKEDLQFKLDRIKKNKNLSQREALERIAYKDRQRRDYYYFHTGQEWGRMENYDICLNTSALSDETCVRLLMKLAE